MADTDTVSLTYQEAAARLGVTVPTCRRMASRFRWERTRANDGTWRVLVPADRLTRQPASETLPAGMPADARALLAHLEAAAADLRVRLERAEGEIESLRPLAADLAAMTAKADAAERRATDFAAGAEKLIAAERQRADDLRAALDEAMRPRGFLARWRRAS